MEYKTDWPRYLPLLKEQREQVAERSAMLEVLTEVVLDELALEAQAAL